MSTVLIIGAQGMVGRPVTRRLVQDGFTVRALARNPVKARARLPAAVDVRAGDIQDIASIDAALQGCTAVYVSVDTPPGAQFHSETQGLANVITAARHHAEMRLMTMTGFRASDPAAAAHPWWHIREKYEAGQLVRTSGLPWTIFEPTWFMESLPLFAKGKTMIVFGGVRLEPWWISGDDYGRMISSALKTGAGQGEAIPVQGPQKVPWQEAAQRFARAWDLKMRVRRLPFILLRATGLVSVQARELAEVLKVSGQLNESEPDPSVRQRFGSPALTIEGYAEYVRRTGDFPQK